MLPEEKQEVEEHLPMAIRWLQDNAIQRYLEDANGKVVVDRAWELAALFRWAIIAEGVKKK